MQNGNPGQGVDLRYAGVATLTVSDAWRSLTDAERIEQVQCDWIGIFEILAARTNGQVIIALQQVMDAARRGRFLRMLEQHLKSAVDPGITVWLEAKGDRNALRLLRGIEVKA